MKRPKCKPMDADWKARLVERNKDYLADTLRGCHLATLRERLLAIGGEEACLLFDPDIGRILARGREWPTARAKVVRGEPCHCHSNSAALWEANRETVSIVTGWALSRDGLWRQHTWCWQRDNRDPKGGRVIETTRRRAAYYGYKLNAREASRFWDDNCF